jgi:ribosomal protein L9
MSKLEVFLREICDKYDEKKFGRIKLNDLIEAIQKSNKIKLTKAQVYLLESILPIDTKY